MTESVFRLTQEQHDAIMQALPQENTRAALVSECGMGKAEFSERLCRKSWQLKTIGEVANVDRLMAADSGKLMGDNACVFVRSMETGQALLENADNLLVVILEDYLLAFRSENGIVIQFDLVTVVGYDIVFFPKYDGLPQDCEEFFSRTKQAFGQGTVEQLSQLTVGIAGASGTGSIVAEQLARMGVKRLVLVDDDVVETCNLGRILNSTQSDADRSEKKVCVLKRAYENAGLHTEVFAVDSVILKEQTVRMLSQCDVLFGCLDSSDGRSQLNDISTFYTIPYFDIGVSLIADNNNSVSQVSGGVNYVLPGASSLLGRGAITSAAIKADSMSRCDPELYRALRADKYIEKAHESAPAVIPVNMMAAALAVNDFLARIHPYRNYANTEIEAVDFELCELRFKPYSPTVSDNYGRRHLGRGDITPLLNRPMLSAVQP